MPTSPAIKRILTEAQELHRISQAPSAFFTASPLETDLFEWHFTVRGPPDTPFEGGLYHGRILLPPEYPFKAPEILILTPNGRFEVNTKICLSITSYHQETWQPSWGIRTILTALVGYLPSKDGGVGSLDFPDEDKRKLARKSLHFICGICGVKTAEQFQLDRHLTVKEKEKLLDGAPTAIGHYQRTETTQENETKGENENIEGEGTQCDVRPNERTQRGETQNETTPGTQGVSSVSEETAEIRQRKGTSAATGKAAGTSTRPRQSRRSEVQEKELLYLSYFVCALIVIILVRRACVVYFSS